jgi:signal transduction histidine kinase
VRHSLRTRLVLSFFGVIVVTAGLVVVLANRITTDRFTYLVSNTGQTYAYGLAPLFADYYAQAESWEGVESLIQGYPDTLVSSGRGNQYGGDMQHMVSGMTCQVETGDENLLLVDAEGHIIVNNARQDADYYLSEADLEKGAPIIVGGRQVGTLVVTSGLGVLTSNQSAFLSQAKQLMVLAAIATGLAVLLVGSFQAQRIVAPVRALADAARRVAGGDLTQRVPVTSQDELGEMAVAFNTMAAELEQQHALRRRAMADVAHELRTPLSVLQIDLESIEDGLTAPTPDVITRLQEEVTLLSRLVEDLRTLSLAEAGELQMDLEEIDARELIRATTRRVRAAAREKGVTISAELPGQLPPITGDGQRLAQVLFNLLSNALRHTPAGGQITITAQHTGEKDVQVSVRDTGEGIPSAELSHVFERFYRTDRARSRDTGGSGLGLSIARSLVEAHSGRIWVHSVEGQGSTFTFQVPGT